MKIQTASALLPIACALALALTGCDATQVRPANRRLLEALQTAVSAKNAAWLDAVEKQVADHRTKGELSEAEFSALDAIIRQAKAGNWDAAQTAVFALSDSQRPTADELEQVRKRKPAQRNR